MSKFLLGSGTPEEQAKASRLLRGASIGALLGAILGAILLKKDRAYGAVLGGALFGPLAGGTAAYLKERA